jgi:hypothetical protein
LKLADTGLEAKNDDFFKAISEARKSVGIQARQSTTANANLAVGDLAAHRVEVQNINDLCAATEVCGRNLPAQCTGNACFSSKAPACF